LCLEKTIGHILSLSYGVIIFGHQAIVLCQLVERV